MKNLFVALIVGGATWVSNVSATIVSIDVSVSGEWYSGGITPFGVGTQPTFNGTLKVDNSLTGAAALQDFYMVTGSKTWTEADLNTSPFINNTQPTFNFTEYSNGNVNWAYSFGDSTGWMILANNNTMNLHEGSNWIACNGCVSFSSAANETIGTFSSYRQNTLVQGGGYEASFDGTNFMINLDIALIGDTLSEEVRQIWEQGIEGFWSNQVTISDGVGMYPLLIDVTFNSQAANADYTLRVRNEYCRSFVAAISEWCTLPMTDNTGQPNLDMQDEVAIHEFGHMLGLYDEYVGGGVDPNTNPDDLCRPITILGVPILRTGEFCDSMMADFGPIQERYFDDIIAYFENVTNRDLTFGMSPLFNTYALTDPGPYFVSIEEPRPQAAPEPGTLWLLGFAIPALAMSRRRRC